jgi:hypothetical protein
VRYLGFVRSLQFERYRWDGKSGKEEADSTRLRLYRWREDGRGRDALKLPDAHSVSGSVGGRSGTERKVAANRLGQIDSSASAMSACPMDTSATGLTPSRDWPRSSRFKSGRQKHATVGVYLEGERD